jgi:hypothetical protein
LQYSTSEISNTLARAANSFQSQQVTIQRSNNPLTNPPSTKLANWIANHFHSQDALIERSQLFIQAAEQAFREIS